MNESYPVIFTFHCLLVPLGLPLVLTIHFISCFSWQQAYTYDTLPSRKKVADVGQGQETYDVPPRREAHPAAHLGYRTIPGARRQGSKDLPKEGTDGPSETHASFSRDIYDVPPNHSHAPSNNNLGPKEHYDTLPKHGGGRDLISDIKSNTLEKKTIMKTESFESPKKRNPVISQLKIPDTSSHLTDIYDAPSAFKHQQQQQQQEVYDIPLATPRIPCFLVKYMTFQRTESMVAVYPVAQETEI